MVTRFEELKIWQLARVFNRSIYELTRGQAVRRDFAFIDQSRRASISVMNNIAEGFERYRRPEFLQYLSTSKASAGEVRSMLYVALDVGYIDQAQFDELFKAAEGLGAAIGGFRSALERSEPKRLSGRRG